MDNELPEHVKEKVLQCLEKKESAFERIDDLWREKIDTTGITTVRELFSRHEKERGPLSLDDLYDLLQSLAYVDILCSVFPSGFSFEEKVIFDDLEVTNDMEGSSSITSQLYEAEATTDATTEATTDASGRNTCTPNVANVLVTGRERLVTKLPNTDCNAVAFSVSSSRKLSSHRYWPPECKTVENLEQKLRIENEQLRVQVQQLEKELEHEKAETMQQSSEIHYLQQKLGGKDSQNFDLQHEVEELQKTVANEQQARQTLEEKLHFDQNQQQQDTQEKANLLKQNKYLKDKLVDLEQKLDLERMRHHSIKQELIQERKNKEKLKKEHEQQIETAVVQERENREQQHKEEIGQFEQKFLTKIEMDRQQDRAHLEQQFSQQIEMNRQQDRAHLAQQFSQQIEMNRQQDEQRREQDMAHLEQQCTQRIDHIERVSVENCAQHQQPESRSWKIQREEVVISDKVLGKGAWGIVYEGKFRASPVAVKQFHDVIQSPHNNRLFEREMEIASICRHPNLVQFIGAAFDDKSPLLLTELLDCDLRHLMKEHRLTQREIVCLALDVAKGLNYLHCNHPPIVHRDLKMDNVLIWRRDDTWRAKVSDFGAANFVRQVMTPNQGAPLYSAPEAKTEQHSQPVDVYSFGLLLLEMCIRESPAPDHGQIQQQMERMPSAELKHFLSDCICPDPTRRPSMEAVIDTLTQLNL